MAKVGFGESLLILTSEIDELWEGLLIPEDVRDHDAAAGADGVLEVHLRGHELLPSSRSAAKIAT